MRCGRTLFGMLVLAAFAMAAPASATPVTVVLNGEWTQVTDNANVTDGSITVGGSFSVTLTFDDSAADQDPDPSFGGYIFPATTSALSMTTGSYTFNLNSGEEIIFGIDDNSSGQDDFGWFAENFTTNGPLPVGVTTGYGYMNPFILDSTETAHSSDVLTDLAWDVTAYDFPGMYFLIAVEGAGSNKLIELIGDFTQFSVVPEPSMFTLMGFGLAAAYRGTRRRV
jgi:hypothetical protein